MIVGGKMGSSNAASSLSQSPRLIMMHQVKQLRIMSPRKVFNLIYHFLRSDMLIKLDFFYWLTIQLDVRNQLHFQLNSFFQERSLFMSQKAAIRSASVAPPSQGIVLEVNTGVKLVGGNEALASTMYVLKTPTTIASAPSVATDQQQQLTTFLIVNAAGLVTMATPLQDRKNCAVNQGSLTLQIILSRPTEPNLEITTQGNLIYFTIDFFFFLKRLTLIFYSLIKVYQGTSTQPAQYIRLPLTTAQTIAAELFPESHWVHSKSGVCQLGGKRIASTTYEFVRAS